MMISNPFDDYCAIEAVNFSGYLKPMLRGSPLHVEHMRRFGSADSTDRMKGRATHCLILEPHTFAEHYAVFEIEGKDRRSKEWKEFEAANPGKALLKLGEVAECRRMADAVRSKPEAMKYLEGGHAEVTMTWTDQETQLKCKARVDWLSTSAPAICDVKAVRTLELRRLQVQADSEAWGNQAAHYLAGYAALNNQQLLPAVMLAIEIPPPHDVAVFAWDGDSLALLERQNAAAMQRIAECMRTKKWPGRHDGEQLIGLPAYRFAEEEDALAEEGGAFAAHGGVR